MNPLKQYRIGFVGLAEGMHRFSFDLGTDFFLQKGELAFEQGQVTLQLELEKTSNMLILAFDFQGEVHLVCDRCLEHYPYTVDLQKRILIKFGDAYAEQSDEIVVIPATESHIDISQFVYEFLHLGLPVRRVHSDLSDGSPGCNPDVIRKLNEYLNKKSTDSEQSPWTVLKSLRFNSVL